MKILYKAWHRGTIVNWGEKKEEQKGKRGTCASQRRLPRQKSKTCLLSEWDGAAGLRWCCQTTTKYCEVWVHEVRVRVKAFLWVSSLFFSILYSQDFWVLHIFIFIFKTLQPYSKNQGSVCHIPQCIKGAKKVRLCHTLPRKACSFLDTRFIF